MSLLTKENHALFALIKNALWQNETDLPHADWVSVENLAEKQGVLWMLYLGGKAYEKKIPAERLKAWRANMIAGVMRNSELNVVQNQLLAYLKEKDIRAAILKGVSCSMYYPIPETRALGDIDVLVEEEKISVVDEYLKENGYSPAENEHPFHVGYKKDDITIEVHRAACDFPDSKGGKAAEEISKRFLEEIKLVEIKGISFPALSDSHQAIMLLTHMEKHMVIGGIGLRQLCDWAVFVNGSAKEHWQEKTLEMLKKCGLLTFAKVVTKTCVNYLGLNSETAPWCMDVDNELTQMMIQDILRSGSMGKAESDNTSSLFFDRAQLGKKGQNRLMGLIVQLNKLAYRHYPFLKKCKILLPFFWVFLPLRYLVRSILGLRPKKSAKKVLMDSAKRQKLYKALDLYGTKN